MPLLCDCQLFLDKCIKLITLLALWEKQRLWVSSHNSPFLHCSCERTAHSVAHSSWTLFTKWTNHSVCPMVGGACYIHVWISALWLTELMYWRTPKPDFLCWVTEIEFAWRTQGNTGEVVEVECCCRCLLLGLTLSVLVCFWLMYDKKPCAMSLPSAHHCKSSKMVVKYHCQS